jgi:hypothetical protein
MLLTAQVQLAAPTDRIAALFAACSVPYFAHVFAHDFAHHSALILPGKP